MKIELDPAKRKTVLETRGLGMADAERVFDGPHLNIEDDRGIMARYGTSLSGFFRTHGDSGMDATERRNDKYQHEKSQ